MEAKIVINRLFVLLLFSWGFQIIHSQNSPPDEYYILFTETKEYSIQKTFWGSDKKFLFFSFKDKNKKIWWTIQYKFDNKRKQKEIVYPRDYKKICFYDPLFVYNENEILKKSKQKPPAIFIVEKDETRNVYYRYQVDAEYPPPPPTPITKAK